ncbi:MAG: hypothetical protein LUD72_06185, partial [Bacteroidales bacterium]|nr:hypothetical protein [Bacteroidales bacterium]
GEKLCKDILNLAKSYGGTYNGQTLTLKYISAVEDYFNGSKEGGGWWNMDLYACMEGLISQFSLPCYEGGCTFNEDGTITYEDCEKVAVENEVTLTKATRAGKDACDNDYSIGDWINEATGCVSTLVAEATEDGTDNCGEEYSVGDWIYLKTGCKVGDSYSSTLSFNIYLSLTKTTESGTDECGNRYSAGAWINDDTGCVYTLVEAATSNGTDECGDTYSAGDWIYTVSGCKVGDSDATTLSFVEMRTYKDYENALEEAIATAIATNCTDTATTECVNSRKGICEEDCAEDSTEPCYDEACEAELKEECKEECIEQATKEATDRINAEYAQVIDAYDECTQEGESFRTELQTLLDDFQDFKDQIIHDMRTGFTLNCPTDSQNITVTVQGENTPFTVNLAGREEESDYNSSGNVVYTLVNKVTNPELWKDTDTVSDIGIPTIVPFDNELYGKNNDGLITYTYQDSNGEDHTELLCYALDNKSGFKGKYKWKHPYLVACADSTCETLPIDTNTSIKYIWNSFECGKDKDWYRDYFIFHMLYRPFEFKAYAWAYMSDIPYYTTKDGKAGKYINMMGLVAGYIYNGTPETVAEGDDPVYFETQTFGNYGNLVIKNDDNTSEDGLVKIRYIEGIERTDGTDGSSLDDDNDDDLAEGCIDDEGTTVSQYTYDSFAIGEHKGHFYIPLPEKEIDMQINDEVCSITRTAYGRASIEIDSDTLISTNEDECVFKVKGTHCGEGATYYIFKVGAQVNGVTIEYPLNNVSFVEITKYDEEEGEETISTCCWAEMDNTDKEWDGGRDNGLHIFSPSTTEDVLKKLSQAQGVNMYGITEYYDENGNLVTEYNQGYGTTGQFLGRKTKKRLFHRSTSYKWMSDCEGEFFIVGINSDNTRFISPVYVTIPLDLNWGYSCESKSLLLTFVAGPAYYIRNYEFDIDISCTVTITTTDEEGNTQEEEKELTIYGNDDEQDPLPNGNTVVLQISSDEEIECAIKSIYNNGAPQTLSDGTSTISADSVEVEITDVSGMTYTCYLKKSNCNSSLWGCNNG